MRRLIATPEGVETLSLTHVVVHYTTRAHEANEAELNRCNGRMRHAFVVRHVIERAHSPLWEGNESENWLSVY